MQQGIQVKLDADMALAAADLSLRFKLPMAGSICYATARLGGTTL
jgi:hypothetical protein